MKYLLVLFSVFAFGQAPNEMVSFTQAQSLGFLLNLGQSHVTSNQCMTKLEATTKYSLNTALLNAYAPNQLIPKSVWADCSVRISSTSSKKFMCHNLGADTSLDPNVPVQGLIGNYYQWGKSTLVANGYTPPGPIAGWNTTPAPDGAWSETIKTATDPCPAGSRVPSIAQFQALIANNTVSRTGTFVESPTNFGSAIHFGPDSATKVLTFPAAGIRQPFNGSLAFRANFNYYWSTLSLSSGGASAFLFTQNTINVAADASNNYDRATGFTVRCISE